MITLFQWPVHKHLLGGPDAKREALKIFDHCKGGLEKNYHNLSSFEFACFPMGLTRNFHGKWGELIYIF